MAPLTAAFIGLCIWSDVGFLPPFRIPLYLRFDADTFGASSGNDNCSKPETSSLGLSFEVTKQKHLTTTPKRERPRVPILQYHDDYVCVNKPPGMFVHRSRSSSPRELVLSTSLKRQLSRKVYPVHRLDHRTSGAILFSFDPKTCAALHQGLRHPLARKQYVALLRGGWGHNGKVVMVNKPLNIRGVMKGSLTKFTCLASYNTGDGSVAWGERELNIKHSSDSNHSSITGHHDPSWCTLVLVEPRTGRTHQIRRHAYSLGHPVIGDTEHGDTKVNRWWRQNMGLDRLALHCFRLDFPLSYSRFVNDNGGEGMDSNSEIDTDKRLMKDKNGFGSSCNRVQCTAPLPAEFVEVLRRVGPLWEDALLKEPSLALEPFDFRGGTFGRGRNKSRRS